MSLLQYSHQRISGAILRRTPRSGYSKQMDNDDDWDNNELSKQSGTALGTLNISNSQEAPQFSSPFIPSNVLENESDNFLYSDSINFKSSLDIESNFRGRTNLSSSPETKYRTNTRRRVLKSKTNLNKETFMLTDDDENDIIDLEMISANDTSNPLSIESKDSYCHAGDANHSLCNEEFTTITFAASRDNLSIENDKNNNTANKCDVEEPLISDLGPMKYAESVVLLTFAAMALLWVTRDPPGVSFTCYLVVSLL